MTEEDRYTFESLIDQERDDYLRSLLDRSIDPRWDEERDALLKAAEIYANRGKGNSLGTITVWTWGDRQPRITVNLDLVTCVVDERDRTDEPALCLNFVGGTHLVVRQPIDELCKIFGIGEMPCP